MDFIRNIFARNTFRNVWWGAHETMEDFYNRPEGLAKAIKDADHNVKVAKANLCKVGFDDLDGLIAASNDLAQHEFNRQTLDWIREY